MKKSKLLVGLSAAFVSAMALASCGGGVHAKGDVLLYVDGVAYTAEDLFKDKIETPDGAQAAFNAVYKVLVRNWANKQGDQTKKEIENLTKNKMSSAKADAQTNASKSGTSYDVEFKKIMTSNGVDTENALYDKFEYDVQKEKFEDRFYDRNYEVLRDGGKFEGKGRNIEGYVKKRHPYHMKHILVKTPKADKTNYATGEIDAAIAEKIGNIVSELAEGNTFGSVAKRYSEDTNSAERFGDVGIMDLDTNFVDEFKLGTYMYETFYGSSTKSSHTYSAEEPYEVTQTAKIGLNLNDTTAGSAGSYADKLSKYKDPSSYNNDTTITEENDKYQGLGTIPYEAAILLKTYAPVTYSWPVDIASITGTTGNNKFLPINVLFNKYFNRHNISIIVPNRIVLNEGLYTTKGNLLNHAQFDKRTAHTYFLKHTDYYRGYYYDSYASKPGFKWSTDGTQGLSKPKNNDFLDSTFKLYDDERENLVDPTQDPTAPAIANTHKQFLHDTEGRTIFVVRGNDGVHFICIERSGFLDKEKDTSDSGEPTGSTTEVDNPGVSLKEYYSTTYPGESGYPQYTYRDGPGETDKHKDKNTYVNYVKGDIVDLKKRATEVKTKLKEYNPNLNKYIYEYLYNEGADDFHFSEKGEVIKVAINNYIQTSIDVSAHEAEINWDKAWQTYYNKLDAQKEERTQSKTTVDVEGTNISKFYSKVVPDLCAVAFGRADKFTDDELIKLFGVGGLFNEK